jgi:hypothetical protein
MVIDLQAAVQRCGGLADFARVTTGPLEKYYEIRFFAEVSCPDPKGASLVRSCAERDLRIDGSGAALEITCNYTTV